MWHKRCFSNVRCRNLSGVISNLIEWSFQSDVFLSAWWQWCMSFCSVMWLITPKALTQTSFGNRKNMPKSLEKSNTFPLKIDWLSERLNCGLIGRTVLTVFSEIDFVETICQYFHFFANLLQSIFDMRWWYLTVI